MIISSGIREKYGELRPFFEKIRFVVRSTFLGFCEKNGFAFSGRVKSLESTAEKLETGRFKAFNEITDLYACTIIVPTRNKIKIVTDFCRKTFSIIPVAVRPTESKEPGHFFFDVKTQKCRLKPVPGTDNNNSCSELTFEVQIRTALEHAWCEATHDVVYKSDSIDWRKYRVAAEMIATLEQFDNVFLAFEEVASKAEKGLSPGIEARRNIYVFFKELFD